MNLYMSFGYVDEGGESHRLFHIEQPIDQAALGNLIKFLQDYVKAVF